MSDTPSDEDEGVVLSAEMIDREERKKQKAAAKAEAEAKKPKRTREEIEAALAKSKLAAAERKRKMRIFKNVGAAAAVAFICWAGFYLFKPYKAGMTFGICKTFLELNVQFPQDLRLSTVEDYGQYIRIWYTQLDAFGEYRMESIQCHFRADEVTGAAVEKILINRKELEPARITEFNKIIPTILAFPPDLTVPPPLPDSLQDLQVDPNAFRFQLNLPQTDFFGERKR